MMKKAKTGESVLALIRASLLIIFNNRIIFFPFIIIVGLQLLLLEILYFSPRYPLKIIFGPIISKIWSEQFLHYPYNFLLLPKLYLYAQIPLYIFVSSIFFGLAILIITKINNGEGVLLNKSLKDVLSSYIHIVLAAVLIFFLVSSFNKLYTPIYERALMMASHKGFLGFLKLVIIEGESYFNLLWSVFITAITAYILPIIIIKKEKILPAIWQNILFLKKSFWQTLGFIFVPSLLFLPILWLRNIASIDAFLPESVLFVMVVSIFVAIVIDMVIYVTLTSYYLWKSEQ